jgi:hypothetical protein
MPAETASIESTLSTKTSYEKADIKSTEIAKLNLSGKVTDTKDASIEIEIIGTINKIDVGGTVGVEVFARAWKGKQQLGFGKDGSVDIERFRFFNPPILVSDPAGTIERSWTNQLGETVTKKYREDLGEAIRQMVARVANLFGKTGTEIEKDKVGKTTSTWNPSLDGLVGRWGTDATWTLARDTADGDTVDLTSAVQYHTSEFRTGPNRYQNSRVFYIFDTGATIGDYDTIDSGFLEVESDSDSTSISAWGLQEGTPASETTLVVGDYDAMTIDSPTRLATDITPSGSAGTRNTWTLNSSGLSAIDKVNKTVLVLRASRDMDNSAPGARSYWTAKMADTAGTTDDPLLSVTYTAGSAPTVRPKSNLLLMGVG